MSKPVLPANRRRKGFESVRKGYRSADARLMFFENGLLYCKLTVGFRGLNLQLHVSFGAVESWCRCALKKAFLFRFALHARKKMPLSRIKKFSLAETLRTSLKSFFTHKNFFCTCLSSLSAKKFPFSQTKSFSFAESFTKCPQKPPFYVQKAFLLHKSFLFTIQSNSFPPSAAHFNVP